MRSADADILFVAGLNGSGEDHWQTRWRPRLPHARLVEQADWDHPSREAWVGALVDAVTSANRPVVLIAHSLGVTTVAHAAPRLAGADIRGAFLVAPPSDKALAAAAGDQWPPTPSQPLPFPSMLVASRSDPYGPHSFAEEKALQWGSRLVDAGEAGHINAESGHGPWPEGLVRLAGFLRGL